MNGTRMNRTRRQVRYGIAVLLAVGAGMLAVFDVDGWPRYSILLIGAAAGSALRTFVQTREHRPDD
jgi:hypothetical protein